MTISPQEFQCYKQKKDDDFVIGKADEIETTLDKALRIGINRCKFPMEHSKLENGIYEKIREEVEKRYKKIGWNCVLFTVGSDTEIFVVAQ